MINTSPLLNYVSSNHDIKAINQWRSDVENQLQESFDHGQSIRDVILTRSNMIDEALIFLWKYAKLDQTDLSLFAVGGYGRRETLDGSSSVAQKQSDYERDKAQCRGAIDNPSLGNTDPKKVGV